MRRPPWSQALPADLGLAAVLGLVGSAATAGMLSWHPAGAPVGFAVTLVVLAAAALAVRRIWPTASLIAVASVLGVYVLGVLPFGPVMFFLLFSLFSTALWLPARESFGWCALAVTAVLTALALGAPSVDAALEAAPFALPMGVAWLLVPWSLGRLLRMRRDSVRRERDDELRRHAFEERLRIAREVHDVVGHSLSVINMQAGVALHVLGKRPEQAAPALEAIKATSKSALEELRGTLAVFRDPERPVEGAGGGGPADPSDDDRRPLPGLDRLPELVTATVAAGLAVRLEVEGERGAVPAMVDHAGYRIVQESLTNALRHAGPATARVRVAYHAGAVEIEVADTGAAAGDAGPGEAPAPGGHGLLGMRERAESLGGRFEAGPRPGGGFAVSVRLPFGGDPYDTEDGA
ncbi:sensor histidine kinase [Allonocardiopsis opalescens]|uniref:histidine kinase n=1 Tax=Allonocardiopsis opalescens TaxID=1144618 RepID=A0A2T0PW11_9ACTN|nr:sensor histidine kinase [Allonocardiopsis opalescens]PRX95711.1 signal transduction histidine kinase [Allonocardiopsis opalescens]